MRNFGIPCLLTMSILTAMAFGQVGKPVEHLGWIESEAHPAPGTPPAVIRADIAAGSKYVLIEDSTKKALKVSIGPTVDGATLAGQHMHIYGYPSKEPAPNLFYVLLVAPSPTTVEEQATEASEAQGKKETEQKKQADLAAAQKEAARRTGFGPERAYRGWVLSDGFLEEGTNNVWYAEDQHGNPFYLSPRVSQHVVVTAKLYTQFEATEDGTYSRTHLVISNVDSLINDHAQPPPDAVRQPETQRRVSGDDLNSPSVKGAQQNSSAGSNSNNLKDPCSLLTSEEISSVLDRHDINKGVSPRREPNTCVWNAQADKYPNWIRLQMLSIADFKVVEAEVNKLDGYARETGVGEDSFAMNTMRNSATHGGNFGQHSELFVRKGDTAFLVMTGGPMIPSVRPMLVDAARALGLKVAAKL